MALYIPHSVFHLARLLYVRPENFRPYYLQSRQTDLINSVLRNSLETWRELRACQYQSYTTFVISRLPTCGSSKWEIRKILSRKLWVASRFHRGMRQNRLSSVDFLCKYMLCLWAQRKQKQFLPLFLCVCVCVCVCVLPHKLVPFISKHRYIPWDT